MKSLETFCKLYLPLIVATILICAVYNSRPGESGSHVAVLPLGGLISFDVPIKSQPVVVVTGWIFVLVILSSYLFINYTTIFPKHFNMEVFYDKPGLDKAVRRLGYLGEGIKLASRHDRLRQQYFAPLNHEILAVTGVADFFGTTDITLHSHGKTSFVVEKCAGIQKYRISEAEGVLTHVMELPRRPAIRLTTLFEHLQSGNDHLNVRLVDLFATRGVLLVPWFKQSLAEDRKATSVIFRSRILGATRVAIVPWPDVSATVYFADLGEEGYVPIGYAVYSWQGE